MARSALKLKNEEVAVAPSEQALQEQGELKVARGSLQESLLPWPGPVGKRRKVETLQGKIEELEKQREVQRLCGKCCLLDLKRRETRGGSTAGTDPGAGGV